MTSNTTPGTLGDARARDPQWAGLAAGRLTDAITVDQAHDLLAETASANVDQRIGTPAGQRLTIEDAMLMVGRADQVTIGKHLGQDVLHLKRKSLGVTALYLRPEVLAQH